MQEFPEAVFLGVAIEMLLDDDEVWLGQTSETTLKGHNFCSDHWIELKFLQKFWEAIFLGVAMKSLLGEDEVLLARTE